MAYTGTHQLADEENQIINPATSDFQDLMNRLLYLLKPLAIVGSGTNRLQMDVANTPTVSVSSLPTLNINNIGGLNGFELQYLA